MEHEEISRKGGEGNRKRFATFIEYSRNGDIDKISQEMPDLFLRHYNTIKKIRIDYKNKPKTQRLSSPCGIWIYGPPGTGKTSSALDKYPDAYLKLQNKWWDNYEGEEVVIIDDVSPSTFQQNHELVALFKIWLDRYPFAAEAKGKQLKAIRPRIVVITSNYPIQECVNNPVDVQAFTRRCSIIHKKKLDTPIIWGEDDVAIDISE